jgi:UDP-GlcNAc:undecaprenyl-phosphate GlcNAc-1-phosphate transferase
MNVPSDWIAFVVALFASFGITIPVRQLALRTGMVDRPGPRKVHAKPMPLLGGIAIYAGFVVAVLLSLHNIPEEQIIGI